MIGRSFAFACVALAGCFGPRTPVPAKRFYAFEIGALEPPAERAVDASLSVRRARVAPRYDGQSFVYRRGEFVSLRHLGEIRPDGTVDTDSPSVRAWAPAYENYRFLDRDGATELQIVMDTLPAYELFMLEAWPTAGARLKALCERQPA